MEISSETTIGVAVIRGGGIAVPGRGTILVTGGRIQAIECFWNPIAIVSESLIQWFLGRDEG